MVGREKNIHIAVRAESSRRYFIWSEGNTGNAWRAVLSRSGRYELQVETFVGIGVGGERHAIRSGCGKKGKPHGIPEKEISTALMDK
jgi:hypothetical protein